MPVQLRDAGGSRQRWSRLATVFVAGAALLLTGCGSKEEAPTTPVTPVVQEPALSKLPTLSIFTAGGAPIASKEVYVAGEMTLTDTSGAVLTQGALEIRGRGNTTWDMPKKPYRVRLVSGASLLGMPSSRHWVLLANFSDKTLIRNELAFEASRMVGLAWTPRSQQVDLRVNGQYLGIYQLTEHVRVATDRVNISSLSVGDTSAARITGGYLLEVDERRGEAFCFNSTMTRMVFCANTPETLLEPAWAKHREYITGYIAKTDSAIFGANFRDSLQGYAAYIDVESAVNYYLVQEMVKNVDGDLRFSSYMYKPRGGKLTFGPVWDFDLAIGNANYYGADLVTGWYSRQAQWFTRLFQDPAFEARVKAKWAQLKANGSIAELNRQAIARGNALRVVQVRNFDRWQILNVYVWPNRVVTGSYEAEVLTMSDWLWLRLRWIDGELSR